MPETTEEVKPTVLTWDTYENAKHQAEFLQEEDPNLSDDDAFEQACQDHDLNAYEWEWMTETLSEELKEFNPDGDKWIACVENFGWRHLSGQSTFFADNGGEFLNKVLPQTDCTFTITIDKKEKLITINNAHHDAPMGGEMYYIRLMPYCVDCGDGADTVDLKEVDGKLVCEYCIEEREEEEN